MLKKSICNKINIFKCNEFIPKNVYNYQKLAD